METPKLKHVRSNNSLTSLERRLASIILMLTLSTLGIFGPAASFGNPNLALPHEPLLRLDPEMHTGWIKRISVDSDCGSLVTAGRDDKTTRMWQLSQNISDQPTIVQKFRHPIGPGNDGKIYAVAISPNGKTVAIGGWDIGYKEPGVGKNNVYIFDTRTGKLLKRIGSLNDVIHHLSFSEHGTLLVAGLHDGQGIRIWDTTTWSLIPNDGNPIGNVYGAIFDSRDHLYSVAYGNSAGYIRKFVRKGHKFKQVEETRTKSGQLPYAIAVSPTASSLAVGFADAANIELYEAEHLALTQTIPLRGEEDEARVSTGVTWSADGQQLFAVLSPRDDFGPKILRSWSSEYQTYVPDITLPLPPVGSAIQLMTCKSRIFVGANEGFGIFEPGTKQLNWVKGANPIFSVDKGGNKNRMRISEDASRISFSLTHNGGHSLLFDLEKEILVKAPNDLQGLLLADTTSLPVSDWEFSLTPKLDGKLLPLEPLERAMAFAISPDKSRFILGTEWRIHAFDPSGKELWCEDTECSHALPTESAILDLNVSKDGQLVVSAHSDGTIRWRRASDGEIVLSLFVDKASNNRWIAWTPKGYFTSSVGGEHLIGWHVNRSLTMKADFFPVHVFRDKYLRPDIVKLVLKTKDEELAIKQANQATPKYTSKGRGIQKISAPVVDILSPKNGDVVSGQDLTIKYLVRSPHHKVTTLTIIIDGSLVSEIPFDHQNVNKPLSHKISFLAGGTNLTITANAGKINNSSAVAFKWTRGPGVALPPKPKLFVVTIGIKAPPLKWPDRDAQDLAQLLSSQPHGVSGLYRDISVRPPLLNSMATKQNILRELKLLREEMLNEFEANGRRVQDTAIIFYSGHGIVDDTNEFFLTPLPPPKTEGISQFLEQFAVSSSELMKLVSNITGRKILMLDACRSGTALGEMPYHNITQTINALNDAVYLYSSADAQQLSFECDQHGCFTEALIGGIQGLADRFPPKGSVNTIELGAHLSLQVPQLRGGREDQLPLYHKTKPSKEFEVLLPTPDVNLPPPISTEVGKN